MGTIRLMVGSKEKGNTKGNAKTPLLSCFVSKRKHQKGTAKFGRYYEHKANKQSPSMRRLSEIVNSQMNTLMGIQKSDKSPIENSQVMGNTKPHNNGISKGFG